MRYWAVGLTWLGVVACGHAQAEQSRAEQAQADDVALPAIPIFAKIASENWSYTFNSESQVLSWRSNRGWPKSFGLSGSGSQYFHPVGIEINSAGLDDWDLNFVIRSGFVHARQDIGGFVGSVNTLTDTSLSTTLRYTSLENIQPYFTLMASLPSGKTMLPGFSTFVRMDPDIMPVATYGEGFNLGPTAGVIIPVNSELSLDFNSGFTWRGRYLNEGVFVPWAGTTFGVQVIDPSKVWTVAASASWTHENFSAQGSVSYALENATYSDGAPFYRSGPRLILAGSATYAWNDDWATSFENSWVHTEKNDFQSPILPASILATEEFNSNSDVYRASLKQTYKTTLFDHALSLNPFGSYLHRSHNSYNSTTLQFVPAKTVFWAGANAVYQLTDTISLKLQAQHLWIHEAEAPSAITTFFPGFGVPTINGDAWSFSFGLTSTLPALDSPRADQESAGPTLMPTGFYIGANAGGLWNQDGVTRHQAIPIFGHPVSPAGAWSTGFAAASSLTGNVGSSNSGGFLGGAQFGYQAALTNLFRIGFEADIQGLAPGNNHTFSGSFTELAEFPGNFAETRSFTSKSLDYFGTGRGRLGMLITPGALLYATGGVAFGGVRSRVSILQNITGPDVSLVDLPYSGGGALSQTRVGWTVGGGAEWMLGANWSPKIEYLFYDLGSATYQNGVMANLVAPPGSGGLTTGSIFHAIASTTSTRFNGHIFRAGLNYHFDTQADKPLLGR
jgi:opacity protein-like surface antigen